MLRLCTDRPSFIVTWEKLLCVEPGSIDRLYTFCKFVTRRFCAYLHLLRLQILHVLLWSRLIVLGALKALAIPRKIFDEEQKKWNYIDEEDAKYFTEYE